MATDVKPIEYKNCVALDIVKKRNSIEHKNGAALDSVGNPQN